MYDNEYTKEKNKSYSWYRPSRVTKSILFIPRPLLKKSSENFHYLLFWCWSILINAEMLIMTKIKFKFVRFCWLSKLWTNNDFSGWLHARSRSMVCDATERDRLMPQEVKAIHKLAHIESEQTVPSVMFKCAWKVRECDGHTGFWCCDFWF